MHTPTMDFEATLQALRELAGETVAVSIRPADEARHEQITYGTFSGTLTRVWSPQKDDVRYRVSLRDGGGPDPGCFYVNRLLFSSARIDRPDPDPDDDPTSGTVWTITITHGEIETAVDVYQ